MRVWWLAVPVLCLVLLGIIWKYFSPKPRLHLRTLVVLGSGGHTGEMFKLLETIDKSRYRPRIYVASRTDPLSLVKAASFEKLTAPSTEYEAHRITRCREVGQRLWTVPPLFIVAFFESLALLLRTRPDVAHIDQWPGNNAPYLFHRMRVVFVESFCRVSSLSATGLILYKTNLADAVVVQWPDLLETYPQAIFRGRLI